MSTSSSPVIPVPNPAPPEPTYPLEASHSPPRGPPGYSYARLSPRMSPSGQPHSPPQADDQPLNLSTETTLCASQQQLINNIVDRMCGAPSINSSVNSDNRSDVPRFFRPENLNNNNNDIEKPAFHKAIDGRLNGMCDVSLIVSKTIDFVIDRAYDDEKEKKEKLLNDNKGPVDEAKNSNLNNGTSSMGSDKREEVDSDKANSSELKEMVISSSGSSSGSNINTNSSANISSNPYTVNSNANSILNPNTRPRKRVKENLEDAELPQKKVMFVSLCLI